MNLSPESPRYMAWSTALAFSTIALGAWIAAWPDSDMREDHDKWVMSMLAIVTAFSFFGFVGHFMAHEMFVGKAPEAGLSTLLLIFWIVGLPAIMKPSNGIAVGMNFGIASANIYFSSWFGFASALFICGHMAEEKTGEKFGNRKNPKTMKWYCLIAASLVVMSSASQIFSDTNCDSSPFDDTDFCVRTKYATSLGVVAAVCALVMILLTGCGKLPTMCEMLVSIALAIMYGFGVAYVTFGDEGKSPARTIGNLYFSTWIGFLVSFLLAMECFADFKSGSGEEEEEEGAYEEGEQTKAPADVEDPPEKAPEEEDAQPPVSDTALDA